MIRDFQDSDKEAFLRLNDRFVHWLSPLDKKRLNYILARANYARCVVDPLTDDMIGALIAYPHIVDYPDHWNIAWLRLRLDTFQYIDRVIVSESAQGQGVGKRLYADLEHFASQRGPPTSHARSTPGQTILPPMPFTHSKDFRRSETAIVPRRVQPSAITPKSCNQSHKPLATSPPAE